MVWRYMANQSLRHQLQGDHLYLDSELKDWPATRAILLVCNIIKLGHVDHKNLRDLLKSTMERLSYSLSPI